MDVVQQLDFRSNFLAQVIKELRDCPHIRPRLPNIRSLVFRHTTVFLIRCSRTVRRHTRYGDLHPELTALARQDRWAEMAALIDDDLLEAIAVVGEPHEIAPAIRARLDGISGHVSLVNNRAPDPLHLAEVVADLHRSG